MYKHHCSPILFLLRFFLLQVDAAETKAYDIKICQQNINTQVMSATYSFYYSSTPAVLNLLRLTDRLVNFDSALGPPLKIVLLAHCGRSKKPYYATL